MPELLITTASFSGPYHSDTGNTPLYRRPRSASTAAGAAAFTTPCSFSHCTNARCGPSEDARAAASRRRRPATHCASFARTPQAAAASPTDNIVPSLHRTIRPTKKRSATHPPHSQPPYHIIQKILSSRTSIIPFRAQRKKAYTPQPAHHLPNISQTPRPNPFDNSQTPRHDAMR